MARIGVFGVMVVLFMVLPFGRQVVELYTDWLWFGEVGFSGVFSTILWTKVLLGAGAGLLAFLVLYLNLLATRRGHGPTRRARRRGRPAPASELAPGGAALPAVPSCPAAS